VKLLVIDSIAFHFRQQFDDMALRTRLLNGLAQDLNKFAQLYELAVSTFYVGRYFKQLNYIPLLGIGSFI
jgi:hypothetical protein